MANKVRFRVSVTDARDAWTESMAWHSESTRAVYRSGLSKFIEVNGNMIVADITPDHIAAMLAYHSPAGKGQTWAVRSVKQRLSQFEQFFDFCIDAGYYAAGNPVIGHKKKMRGIASPKPQHLRIPRSEWAAVLAAAEHPTHRALIATGFYTCLRINELVALSLQDLNLDTWELTAWRKKVKDTHTLTVPMELRAELHTYLAWYSKFNPKPHHPLFPPLYPGAQIDALGSQWANPTVGAKHQNQYAAGRQVKRILARAGYDHPHMGAHTLRRSGARAFYDHLVTQGYDGALRSVQTLLGHTTPTTTEKYLGVDIDQRRLSTVMDGWMFGEPEVEQQLKAV